MHNMGWFSGGWFTMAIWWVVLAAAVFFVIKSLTRQRPVSGESPLGILKRRYARGEISKEEFEEKKHSLDL